MSPKSYKAIKVSHEDKKYKSERPVRRYSTDVSAKVIKKVQNKRQALQLDRSENVVKISQYLKDQLNTKNKSSPIQSQEMNFTFSKQFEDTQQHQNQQTTQSVTPVEKTHRQMIKKRSPSMAYQNTLSPQRHINSDIKREQKIDSVSINENNIHTVSAQASTRNTTRQNHKSENKSQFNQGYGQIPQTNPSLVGDFNDNFNVDLNISIQQSQKYEFNQNIQMFKPKSGLMQQNGEYNGRIIKDKPSTSNMVKKYSNNQSVGLDFPMMPHEQFIGENIPQQIHLPDINQSNTFIDNDFIGSINDKSLLRNQQFSQLASIPYQKQNTIVPQQREDLYGVQSPSKFSYQTNINTIINNPTRPDFSNLQQVSAAQQESILPPEINYYISNQNLYSQSNTKQRGTPQLSKVQLTSPQSRNSSTLANNQYNNNNPLYSPDRMINLRNQNQSVQSRSNNQPIEYSSIVSQNTKYRERVLSDDKQYRGEGILVNSPHRIIKGSNQLPQAFRIFRQPNFKKPHNQSSNI